MSNDKIMKPAASAPNPDKQHTPLPAAGLRTGRLDRDRCQTIDDERCVRRNGAGLLRHESPTCCPFCTIEPRKDRRRMLEVLSGRLRHAWHFGCSNDRDRIVRNRKNQRCAALPVVLRTSLETVLAGLAARRRSTAADRASEHRHKLVSVVIASVLALGIVGILGSRFSGILGSRIFHP